MAKAANGSSTDEFRLLWVEYQFAAGLTHSEPLAARLVNRFLEEGEVDRDGRRRYKIWEIEALPGGVTPSPYDGAFWRSDHARGIHCEINHRNSSARWTGPVSAEWRAFDGRQTAQCDVGMIRLNHALFVEFLQSAGVPFPPELGAELAPPAPSSSMPVSEKAAEASSAASEALPASEWDPQSDWTVESVMLNLEIGGSAWAQKEVIEAVAEMPTKLKRYRGKSIPEILDNIKAAVLRRALEEMGCKPSPDSCERLVNAWKAWRVKQPARDC
jgi:hypothetical protein